MPLLRSKAVAMIAWRNIAIFTISPDITAEIACYQQPCLSVRRG
jgi:hypothetical protein